MNFENKGKVSLVLGVRWILIVFWQYGGGSSINEIKNSETKVRKKKGERLSEEER